MDSIIQAKQRIIFGSPHCAVSDSGGTGLATFSTDMAAPMRSCRIGFTPIQDGSGAQSPSNIRPFTGWTGINVTRTGKSMVPFLKDSMTWDASGYCNTYIGWCEPWRVPDKNATYVYSVYIDSVDSGPESARIWFNRNGVSTKIVGVGPEIESGQSGWSRIIENLPQLQRAYPDVNCDYAYFGIRLHTNSTASHPMVELGDTRTEYEPYAGNTYAISWQGAAGTLYGGYVDVISGTIVETWRKFTSPWGAMTFGADLGTHTRKTLNINRAVRAGEAYSMCSATDVYLQDNSLDSPHYYVSSKGTTIYCVMPNDTSNGQDIEFVCELATPAYYYIAPQQIQTLVGTNHIMSDSNGGITAKYWTH